MTDTQYKVVNLAGLDQTEPPDLEPLRPNTLMTHAPLRAVSVAQDAVCATSRRVVGMLGISGTPAFHVPASGAPVQQVGSHSFPDFDTWRSAGWIRTARLTPGCYLRARVYYVPSGNTQYNSSGTTWDPAGPFGAIQLVASWVSGANSDGPDSYALELPSSQLTNAAAPSDDAGMWAAAAFLDFPEIRPSLSTNANIANWTENLESEIEVQYRGSPRVLAVVVYEEPVVGAYLHSSAGPHALNGYSALESAQTTVPQEKAADGATYDEHRFGTHRLLGTAERQQQVVGPVVFDLQAWDEGTQDDNLDVEPVSISATSFVNILDTSQTAYDRSLPGHIVAGSHAQVHDLCDRFLYRTDQIWGPELEGLYCPYSGLQGSNDGSTYDATYGARNFDAVGDDCRWSVDYDITNNPITISLWLRITNMAAMRRPILLATSGGTAAMFIDVFTTGNVRIWWEHDGGGSVDMQRPTAAGAVTINTWHHVVITGTGSSTATTWSIYVDGVEATYSGSGTNGVGTPRATSIYALSYYVLASPTNGWLGDIADVRAWSRVLTAPEIANIYADALDSNGDFVGFPDPQLAMACVLPARTIVEARLTGSATEATVRIQSGAYEWIDHTIDSTSWATYEATGFLESQVTPDHAWAVCQVFAQVDADTVEIRNVSACYGR